MDPVTHTVYVADGGSLERERLAVRRPRLQLQPARPGCGNVSTLQAPDGNPVDIAVNPVTDTL